MKYFSRKMLLIGLAWLTLTNLAFSQSQSATPQTATTQTATTQTATTQTEPLVNRLHGSWQGDGKTLGMPARLQMKWEAVLGNKFVRLSLRNEIGPTGKTQVFEGHAYYQAVVREGDRAGETKSENNYEARWFDSRGLSFPIKAQVEGESLVALWGSPETEQGKSVYRLLEPGKMEVVDWVKQKDGAWKEFGRFLVVRE